MAKKTQAMPVPEKHLPKPKPNCRILVKAQDGLSFKTGESVTLTVSGKLRSVNTDDYDGMMSIELEPASLKPMGKGTMMGGAGSLTEDLAELSRSRGKQT